MKNKIQALVQNLSSSKYVPYFFIVFLGFIICLPILRDGIISGHDLLFHIYRDHSVVNSLKDGQLFPQVDPEALGGFGYSWNMFYGPLSTYITAALRALTGGWAAAINAFILLSVIASGIFMYRFMHEVTKRKLPALFVSVLYMAAPYHLVDIYVRQAQGELLPFVFAPILFHGIYRAIHYQKGIFMIAAGFAGIILSHNISALIFGFFAALYLLLNLHSIAKVRTIRHLIIAGVLALGLSALYTLPLLELRQTGNYGVFDSAYMDEVMGTNANSLQQNALNIARLAYNPVTVTGGSSEVMPFSLGFATFVGLGLFAISYKNMPRKARQLSQQSIILALVSLLLTTTLVPWEIMPKIFYNIQFPWRFLMASVFFLSIATGLSFYYTFNRLLTNRRSQYIGLIALTSLAVYSALPILSLGTYGPIEKAKPLDYSLTYQNLLAAQWVDQYSSTRLHTGINTMDTPNTRVPAIMNTLQLRKKEPLVISGSAQIGAYTQKGLHASFSVRNQDKTTVELPYNYYPGYQAYLLQNSTKIPLDVSESSNGLVLVGLPKESNGVVYSSFGMSKATVAGLALSALSLMAILVFNSRIYKRLTKTRS